MPDFDVIEMKPFVPAKDFELSKRFYQDVGFTLHDLYGVLWRAGQSTD